MGQTVVIEDDRKSEVAGDFVTVYEAHYPRLVRALEIGGLDRPTAEDVAQEAFARTLGHWRRVRLGTNPPGYVYRTAFRLSRSHWKHEYPLETEQASRRDTAAEAVSNLGLEAALEPHAGEAATRARRCVSSWGSHRRRRPARSGSPRAPCASSWAWRGTTSGTWSRSRKCPPRQRRWRDASPIGWDWVVPACRRNAKVSRTVRLICRRRGRGRPPTFCHFWSR